eukprot:9205-Pyramimonas_sp.AAC.2
MIVTRILLELCMGPQEPGTLGGNTNRPGCRPKFVHIQLAEPVRTIRIVKKRQRSEDPVVDFV